MVGVVMTTMTVTSMTTTMVKMTVVVEALKAVEGEISVGTGPERESLESPRPHSLDMPQQDILI